MHKFLLLLFSFTTLFTADAQTCKVKGCTKLAYFERSYKEDIEAYKSLVFIINGKNISVLDTAEIEIPLNKEGFDTIQYSYIDQQQKTVYETSLCKLKDKETYMISPCTCCGIFLIVPSSKAERGFVKFVNKSNKELYGMASEFDYDTIPKKSSTGFISADISMNCGFRPSDILVQTEPRVDSEPSIYKVSYLFLHAEKLVLTIEKNGTDIHLELQK